MKAPWTSGKERWIAAPGFEGRYEVSTRGRVRSLQRKVRAGHGWRIVPEKVLTVSWHGNHGAYPYVTLNRGRRRINFQLHRLVLLSFVGPPPSPGCHAAHGPDFNPANCRLDNLRWLTPAENYAERYGKPMGPRTGFELELDRADEERAMMFA